MQKIMFNDRYHHTNAVIEERKTRATQIMAGIDFPVNMVMGRVLPDKDGKIYAVANGENIIVKLRYKVGEVVAVAQCYNDVVREFTDLAFVPGSTNKMFVRPNAPPNPHHRNPLRAVAGYFGRGVHKGRSVCRFASIRIPILFYRHKTIPDL